MLIKHQHLFFIHLVILLNNKRLILPFILSLFFSNSIIAKESNNIDGNNYNDVFFPYTQLYPHYIANPLRPTFGMQNMYFSKNEIVNTSERRYNLKLGGHLGIYRNQPEKTNRGWQVTFNAGFQGQFDPASSQENVGWNGIIALSLEIRNSEAFAHNFAVHHTSSHVGDEIIERTGIKRINYTREEIRYGLMWFMSPHWQSYIEIGKAYHLGNSTLQRQWRHELGFQYENKKYWMPKLGWYMGADFSSYEENNGDINTSLQLGLVTMANKRNYRLGFEFNDAHSSLGEFFQSKEKYISFGFWIDI